MVKVTIFWRDGAAYLDWREGGKRSRVAIGRVSPRKAEGVRAAKEAELTHGVRILPRLPTVRDFLEPYLEWYKAEHPTTHGKAKSEVRLFMARFGHRPIDTLRPMEMESYKTDHLTKDRVSPETVGKEVRRLQAAFRRGVQWKELDFNPREETRAPRGVRSVAVRFYDRTAMRKLYRANPARPPPPCGCSWPIRVYAAARLLEWARVRRPGAGSGSKAIQTKMARDARSRASGARCR